MAMIETLRVIYKELGKLRNYCSDCSLEKPYPVLPMVVRANDKLNKINKMAKPVASKRLDAALEKIRASIPIEIKGVVVERDPSSFKAASEAAESAMYCVELIADKTNKLPKFGRATKQSDDREHQDLSGFVSYGKMYR